MNDYYQFAILSAVVLAVYAFLYFVVHPLAKWIAIKTPNKFDNLLVKKKVISRALFFVPVIILVQSFPYVLAKGHWLYEFCEHIGNILFTVAAFLNVLYYELTDGAWLCVRPSGTEPKIKFYFGIRGTSMEDAIRREDEMKAALDALVKPLI